MKTQQIIEDMADHLKSGNAVVVCAVRGDFTDEDKERVLDRLRALWVSEVQLKRLTFT